jgi:sphingomyelin phosphodiesterase 2
MRGAAERGHLVIGLGDFNMIPNSLAHQLISTHSSVRDVWFLLHPDSSVGAAIDEVEKKRGRPIPTVDFNITENGATCDSVLNTWRWNKAEQKLLGSNKPKIEVSGDKEDPRAKRLDYIFVNTGVNPSNSANGGWVVQSAKLGMLSRHPELQCSLSDHFSIEATLVRSQLPSANSAKVEGGDTVNNGVYLQSPANSELRIPRLPSQLDSTVPECLPIETYDEILAMIAKYRLRERRQRRLRLSHFLGSLVVSIGCLVAVWWSPHNFVAFLLMLLSTLGLSTGVIDGLIGGLFVGSEIRALKEFEWDISNARAAAQGEPHVMAEEGIIDW